MNAQPVKYSADGKTVWIRIPRSLAKPIEGGCQCTYCMEHPEITPLWDAVCVRTAPAKGMEYSATVHFPRF